LTTYGFKLFVSYDCHFSSPKFSILKRRLITMKFFVTLSPFASSTLRRFIFYRIYLSRFSRKRFNSRKKRCDK